MHTYLRVALLRLCELVRHLCDGSVCVGTPETRVLEIISSEKLTKSYN